MVCNYNYYVIIDSLVQRQHVLTENVSQCNILKILSMMKFIHLDGSYLIHRGRGTSAIRNPEVCFSHMTVSSQLITHF